ncbi:Na+/H+ antiporter [Serinibacter arcticus]|uniref:Na+/H+ antiporter n=1 Tax=Serinibacter arcticus TaxID=1655435 RepID=A0A4Z1E1W4_9MICO|nr:Na+/H+ antiporter [Serinibacter arcticus]TGO04988.1 Na+/H+ antiporter [Serinibacter arcticus]
MDALELVVVLGAAIVVGEMIGRRVRLPTPILLLALGALLGFAPALRAVHLPSDLVLLVFLPALLYREAIVSSMREIRRSLRGVVLVSTLLVVLSAAAVAALAHAFGMAWGPAWVLGAALAPTDATAVGAMARLLPRRMMGVLRSESLVNDGTALVLYGVAVGVTVGEETLTAGHLSWLVVLSYGGGILAGLLVALVGQQARRRISDVLLANTVTLVTPFAAFLLAETVEASGVLAVVVAGLVLGRRAPREIDAATRRVAEPFWSLGAFVLNGALFVLVGIEVQSVVRALPSDALARAVGLAVAVWITILLVRAAFLYASAYLIRALDRRPSQLARRVSNRSRIVSTAAGFRGAVSLAAALGVPTTVSSGEAFPDRDLVVFVTAVVVVLTLVAQGLALPAVVRWARFAADDSAERERELASRVATREALDALPALAAELGVDDDEVALVRERFEQNLRLRGGNASPQEISARERSVALTLALLGHKRATIVRLRDEQEIDDAVMRELQARIDVEELALSEGDLTLD